MTIQVEGLVDVDRGMLDRRVFSDEEVYQLELERVFGRAWLWVGHDSLVPNPNDFFLTYMGEDPVILTRDGQGQVHAFLNMCRHRGNRVARADDGNAKNFMCTYHGWTYSNDGKLVSVPGLQEAYYGELDVDKLGLVEVAQLSIYAGHVFATWDAQAPSLEDYLGDMRWYLDSYLNRRDNGVEVIGPDKWIIPTNWKLPADNFSGDNYHVSVTHRGSMLAMSRAAQFPDMPEGPLQMPGYGVAPGTGHGVSMLSANTEAEFEQMLGIVARHPLQAQYYRDTMPEVERRLGALRAKRLLLGVSNTFPNFTCHIFNNLIRVWHPRGPFHTEVWAFVILDKDMPAEVKDAVRVMAQQTFNPSGLFEQDDMDNWRQCTEAGKSLMARSRPQHLAMGIGHEGSDGTLPGLVHSTNITEVTQRGLYAGWQNFMNAGDWSEIDVAPHTAKYEGTATFH